MEILTIGTFDIPHYGHLRLLNICNKLGNLTVGVNSDEFVERYKGKPPIQSELERMQFFKELGYKILLNESAGKELIEAQMPDIVAIGSDWAEKDYLNQIDVSQSWLDENGISILYIANPRVISTTEIKRRCNELT